MVQLGTEYKSKSRRKIFGLSFTAFFATLALLVGGGVAVAAVVLTSNVGEAKAEAYQEQPLVISDAHFSKKFYPGAVADLVFTVENDNPFPATLTAIKLKQEPLVSAICRQHFSGPASTTKEGTVAVSATVPAGKSLVVTVPKALKLSDKAPGGCSITVEFTVAGTGAGNE